MDDTIVKEENIAITRDEETVVKEEETVVKEEDLAPADVKPSRKALLAARLKDLEVSDFECRHMLMVKRQLEMATVLPRAEGPTEVVDLTGDDWDME